jgi:hypothetical protein
MSRLRLLGAALLVAAACGDDATVIPPTPDSGVDLADAGVVLGPAPAQRRVGGRQWGRTVELTVVGRELWIGSVPLPDPSVQASVPRGGLSRLALDEGSVRRLDAELPSDPLLGGPVPTGGVVVDGTRTLVVSTAGLLELGAGGAPATVHALVSGRAPATPTRMVLDRAGGRAALWVSTDRGLFELDPDTLTTVRVLGAAELGSDAVGPLAVDPATGDLYVGVAQGAGTAVARLATAGAAPVVLATLAPGQAGVPAGDVADLVWSADDDGVFVALTAWDPAAGGVVHWDGADEVLAVASEGELAVAADGGTARPFGTALLELDAARRTLIVAGRIRSEPLGGLIGGGIAFLDLGALGASPPRGAGMGARSGLPGAHVSAMALDPATGRLYANLATPCDELHLANLGLYALSFDGDGKPRLERPILSGVRELVVDGGVAYAALRDDNPGVACDGFEIRTGFVRLLANGAGEVVRLGPVYAGTDDPLPIDGARIGPVRIATRAGRWAFGTWRDGILLGDLDRTEYHEPLEAEASVWQNDVAFRADHELWIASRTVVLPGDPPDVVRRSPRGAALVTLRADGGFGAVQHYARDADPEDTTTITGLPSNEVRAAVVAPDGSTYLVCATERVRSASALDRVEGAPYDDGSGAGVRRGGVARIAPDGTVSLVAGPDVAPDPRAAAIDDVGRLWVVDAERGLLVQRGDRLARAGLPLALPDGALAVRLVLATGGALLLGSDRGGIALLGGGGVLLEDLGWIWAGALRAPGVLLVGTDEGLVRLVADGAADVPEAAPAPASPPPFHELVPVGGGMCVDAGMACSPEMPCCPGLSCMPGFFPICG